MRCALRHLALPVSNVGLLRAHVHLTACRRTWLRCSASTTWHVPTHLLQGSRRAQSTSAPQLSAEQFVAMAKALQPPKPSRFMFW